MKNTNFLGIIFLTFLMILLFLLINNKKNLDFFQNVFGIGHLPPPWTPENDCFPGNYFRSQLYQNVCQPQQGLLRQKIPLQDNCQRGLGGKMSPDKNYYLCSVDKHLNRRCKWVKENQVNRCFN